MKEREGDMGTGLTIGGRYIITDIHPKDGYHRHKDKLIGKVFTVKVDSGEYEPGYTGTNGRIDGKLYSFLAIKLKPYTKEGVMDKPFTDKQARLYAMLTWEELARRYEAGERFEDEARAKGEAVKKLAADGVILEEHARVIGSSSNCAYCVLYFDYGPCRDCPYDNRIGNKRCMHTGPYHEYRQTGDPRPMFELTKRIYFGHEGAGKGECKDAPKEPVFAVKDRVKLVREGAYSGGWDVTANNGLNPPLWGHKPVGGKVLHVNTDNVKVLWDHGESAYYHPHYLEHLTDADTQMLATRPINPGDAFHYMHEGGLHTLVAVDDGCEDIDLRFIAEWYAATTYFDPEYREDMVDALSDEKSFNVYFDRLVPIGRAKITVEPDTK
jgi:hypothetical protein